VRSETNNAPLGEAPGIATIFQEDGGLRLVGGRGLDADLLIFAHVHPPEGSDRAVQAFTFSWAFGQDSTLLRLPFRSGDRVYLGQFKEIEGAAGVTYINKWALTVEVA
jgi:hypothetical protein